MFVVCHPIIPVKNSSAFPLLSLFSFLSYSSNKNDVIDDNDDDDSDYDEKKNPLVTLVVTEDCNRVFMLGCSL